MPIYLVSSVTAFAVTELNHCDSPYGLQNWKYLLPGKQLEIHIYIMVFISSDSFKLYVNRKYTFCI